MGDRRCVKEIEKISDKNRQREVSYPPLFSVHRGPARCLKVV